MYAFDYRQLLMERVRQCCHRHLAALPCREDHYYHLVAKALLEQLQELAPGRCSRLTPAQLALPAGQQYDLCYRAVTGRAPRLRDCRLLDKMQRLLMAQALEQSL